MTSRIQCAYNQVLQKVVFCICIPWTYMAYASEARFQRTGTENDCSAPDVIEEGRANQEEVLWVSRSGTGKHEIGEIFISSGFR